MPLHLHYDQTEDLLYDFTKNHIMGRRARWILIILIVVVALLLLINLIRHNFALEALIGWELGFALFLVFYIILLPRIAKRSIARSVRESKFGLKREMLISEAEIVVKTQASDSTFGWDGILKSSESEMSYYLYIASNQALLIPKDCLSAEDETELLSLLNRKGLPLKK